MGVIVGVRKCWSHFGKNEKRILSQIYKVRKLYVAEKETQL